MQGLLGILKHMFAMVLIAGHAFLAVLLPHHSAVQPQVPAVAATSTAPALFPVATTKVKTTPKKSTIKPAQSLSTAHSRGEAGSASASATTVAKALTSLSQGVVNDAARAAIVNILCIPKSNSLSPISGSGVIITNSGVVLTNAHAAQFFLLRDYPTKDNVDCVIRTGSPAHPTYRAHILYLPPAWISANANQITAEEATGSGEHDYAFLQITASTDPNGALPTSFPHLAMTLDDPAQGEPVIIAGYPAGYLEGIVIENSLYSASAVSTVKNVFAFDDAGNADLVDLGNTIVTQAGSSGGAVVRIQDGALHAIAATATMGATTDARELRGITLSHIDRSLRSQGQGGIATLLSGDLKQKADYFASSIAPSEKQKLIDALNH